MWSSAIVFNQPSSFTLAGLALTLGSACSEDGGSHGESWQLVLEDLPGALLSVWGSAADDVWTVGGDSGDGDGPMVLHYDGSGWTRENAGIEGDLWWVFGFAGGPVFMSGAEGQIIRHDGGRFERLETPGSNTVYGVWGVAPDDMWAVGGAGSSPTGGFIWRFDGERWRAAEAAPSELETSATVFKVWGRAHDDVWFVGSDGLLLHYDGALFERVDAGTQRTLLTVHGAADRTLAVGGYVDGVIVSRAGPSFEDVTPARAPQFAGVFVSDAGAFAVGIAGSVYSDAGGSWTRVETKLSVSEDLHSVWVDPEGGVWTVGGRIASSPLLRGVLLHRGKTIAGASFD
jgi:hypothetical protein